MDALWESALSPLIFVTLFAAVGVLLLPVMQGVRRRIEGDGGPDVQRLRDDVDALRAEVAALREAQAQEPSQARLLELEERLDFAERLIASGRTRPLAGGQ
jgi:hypothetical protein